jgi:hypothetical protein
MLSGAVMLRGFVVENVDTYRAAGFAHQKKDPEEGPRNLLQLMLQINSRTPPFHSEMHVRDVRLSH